MHKFVHRWGLAIQAPICADLGQACQKEETVGGWPAGPAPDLGGGANWGQGQSWGGAVGGGPADPAPEWGRGVDQGSAAGEGLWEVDRPAPPLIGVWGGGGADQGQSWLVEGPIRVVGAH